jgi:hypothetical protein
VTARKINSSTKCLLIGTSRTYFRAEGISGSGRSETRRDQAVSSEEAIKAAKNERSSEEEGTVSLFHVSL